MSIPEKLDLTEIKYGNPEYERENQDTVQGVVKEETEYETKPPQDQEDPDGQGESPLCKEETQGQRTPYRGIIASEESPKRTVFKRRPRGSLQRDGKEEMSPAKTGAECATVSKSPDQAVLKKKTRDIAKTKGRFHPKARESPDTKTKGSPDPKPRGSPVLKTLGSPEGKIRGSPIPKSMGSPVPKTMRSPEPKFRGSSVPKTMGNPIQKTRESLDPKNRSPDPKSRGSPGRRSSARGEYRASTAELGRRQGSPKRTVIKKREKSGLAAGTEENPPTMNGTKQKPSSGKRPPSCSLPGANCAPNDDCSKSVEVEGDDGSRNKLHVEIPSLSTDDISSISFSEEQVTELDNLRFQELKRPKAVDPLDDDVVGPFMVEEYDQSLENLETEVSTSPATVPNNDNSLKPIKMQDEAQCIDSLETDNMEEDVLAASADNVPIEEPLTPNLKRRRVRSSEDRDRAKSRAPSGSPDDRLEIDNQPYYHLPLAAMGDTDSVKEAATIDLHLKSKRASSVPMIPTSALAFHLEWLWEWVTYLVPTLIYVLILSLIYLCFAYFSIKAFVKFVQQGHLDPESEEDNVDRN